jgi:aspartyl-tRNA(Asn)/glutamyl-tRNA(Gln) amidotransferase subunit A
MADYLSRPIADLAERLRDGTITAIALAEEAIERHAKYGAALNAYKSWDAARLRRAARAADIALRNGGPAGPLHGLPVSVKDLYGVEGYPTFAGTPTRLPSRWEAEGPVVRRLRQQAALITGKTHTVEFAFGGIGTNRHWGAPRNPWGGAQHYISGGSSSGAGVSLGEGSAVLALGTDTGGSVRLPATFTGNVGLKTTSGRWSCDGIVPLAPTLDTPGILARSVADTAYAFAALDPGAPDLRSFMTRVAGAEVSGLRIGFSEPFMWEDLDPGIGEAAKRALDEVARKGARIVPFDIPEFKESYEMHLKGSVLSVELKQFLDDELPQWKTTLDPIIQRRVEDGGSISAIEYIRRRRFIAEKGKAANARLAEVDVLATPMSPLSPPRLDDVSAIDDYVRHNRKSFRFSCPINNLGLSALTIPVGRDAAGMPVGLQLVARSHAEERLLEVGAAFERVLGTARQRLGAPPLAKLPTDNTKRSDNR